MESSSDCLSRTHLTEPLVGMPSICEVPGAHSRGLTRCREVGNKFMKWHEEPSIVDALSTVLPTLVTPGGAGTCPSLCGPWG